MIPSPVRHWGAAAGWKDAVTMVPADPTDADNEDDGSPVAECLGLAIERFDTQAWRQRTDIPEAEFIATAWGGVMVRFAGMEARLRGTLLILGGGGDRTWQPNSEGVLPNWCRPRTLNTLSMGQESLWEFQLRVGIITVFPATYAATHWDKLRLLMISEEMQPWSIGGDYDRPFPRQIAEEMGVPRELFGQRKMALGHDHLHKNPSVKGYEDYARFLKEVGLLNMDKNGNFTLVLKSITPHFFHWGIDRTMRRYVVDVPED